jgi:hypothetical protein
LHLPFALSEKPSFTEVGKTCLQLCYKYPAHGCLFPFFFCVYNQQLELVSFFVEVTNGYQIN